jgi:hypothetical protein
MTARHLVIPRLFTALLAIGLIMLSALIAWVITADDRDHELARYDACDQLVDRSRSHSDTADATRWCGDHGVLFTFDTAPRRVAHHARVH